MPGCVGTLSEPSETYSQQTTTSEFVAIVERQITGHAASAAKEATTISTATPAAAEEDRDRTYNTQKAKRTFEEFNGREAEAADDEGAGGGEFSQESQTSTLSERSMEIRMNSWETIISNALSSEWRPIGLLSTTDNHTAPEKDLGHR